MPPNKKNQGKRRKRKCNLSAAERRARRERNRNFMTVFINGKQKRVPRPPMIDGLPVDEFIERNADPIWLHQNGLWKHIVPEDDHLLHGSQENSARTAPSANEPSGLSDEHSD